MIGIGATREQIKRINESLNEVIQKAAVMQEDIPLDRLEIKEQIDVLKKVEIKFAELVEKR